MKNVDFNPHPDQPEVATLIHHRTGERCMVGYIGTQTPSSDGSCMFPGVQVRRIDPKIVAEVSESTGSSVEDPTEVGGDSTSDGGVESIDAGDAPPEEDAESSSEVASP